MENNNKRAKEIYSNLLEYQQKLSQVSELIDKYKSDFKKEVVLKLNNEILEREINAIDKIELVESTSKGLMDRWKDINDSILENTDLLKTEILERSSEFTNDLITESEVLDPNRKGDIIQFGEEKIEHIDDALGEVIKKGKDINELLHSFANDKISSSSQNMENIVSKTGDLSERVANQLLN